MDLFASKSTLFLLCFIGCCAGQHDILPEGPVEAKVGTNATLKTLLKKPDYFVILWNHQKAEELVSVATMTPKGLRVEDQYKGRAWINATNGDLHLGPLTPEDNGDYSISITYTDGSSQSEQTKLEVLEPVSDVVITSNLPEAIEHKSTVVLNCSSKGSFLKFNWLNRTTLIEDDGKRLLLKEEDLSSTLTIKDVLRSDLTGPIYCTAANNLDIEKSAPFNLTVYYGPEKVGISPANPPAFLKSGSNFNMTCSAVSSPPATFVWYHDQQMMEASGPVLTLELIEKHRFGEAAGNYTCKAINAKTELSVHSPAVAFSVMDAIVGVKISGPTEVLLAGNSSANISCQVMSGTVKTKTWLKDGKPLSAGDRVVMADDMSSVMIKELQKEDNGDYVCQFSNPISTVKASYKMVVNYGPEPVKVDGANAVEVNDPVTLTCSAASVPPANFTWKFNGTMTPIKTSTYTIEKAVYKNTGTYTCEARNDVTGKTSMHTHILSVKEEGTLDEGLSDGAIAGIVIGVLAALAIAIGLIIYCRQKVPVESPY